MSRLRRNLGAVAALAAALLALTPAAWSFFAAAGAGTGSASVTTLQTPSAVSASASGNSVDLSWSGPTAPGGGAVDGYYVQRSPGSAGGNCTSSPSSLLAASSAGCTDTGLATGTYTHTVVAVYRSWTSSAAANAVEITAAVVHHFDLTVPSTGSAGAPIAVTVTAKDASGANVAGYAGTKALSWSGGTAAPNGSTPTYPAAVTFSGGVGSASITLVKAEIVTLMATEGTVTGTSGVIAVSAGAVTQLALTAGTPQVAGTSFSVGIIAQDLFRNTATGYTGAKSLVWSGPGAAPSGSGPTYPVSVSFTAGTGSASVTLTKVETVTLIATEGSLSGSSSPVVVGAGAASRLAWSQVALSKGALSTPCRFTCTGAGVDNFGTFTARVAVTDMLGNTVSNVGTGHAVTVSVNAGSGGSFTSPTSGASVGLTIAASGPAESTATFTFRAQNGNWTSNAFTASKVTGAAYTSATGSVTK